MHTGMLETKLQGSAAELLAFVGDVHRGESDSYNYVVYTMLWFFKCFLEHSQAVTSYATVK